MAAARSAGPTRPRRDHGRQPAGASRLLDRSRRAPRDPVGEGASPARAPDAPAGQSFARTRTSPSLSAPKLAAEEAWDGRAAPGRPAAWRDSCASAAFGEIGDELESLLERIGGARLVLIGEAKPAPPGFYGCAGIER
jgi:hypothetical protein